MTRGRFIFFLVSVVCLLPVATGSLSSAVGDRSDLEDSLTKQLSVFTEVLSLVRRAYVEEAPIDALLAGALDGTTDALDPLSTFVPPGQVEAFETVRRVGGSRSGLTVAKDRGVAFVVAVEEESPAALLQIRRGDILARIAQRSTRAMPLWQLQKMLAGEPGTELELELLRAGQTRLVTLRLEEFPVAAPSIEERRGVAVLRVRRLGPGAVDEVRSLLAELAGDDRDKLVFDLRGLAGGEGETAYALAGLFARGELGSMTGGAVTYAGTAEPVWTGELVVLVDSGSQGPAEVLATVLRQRAGARLVGERTFGLAGRQRLVQLSNGAGLLLTEAFYTGPDGAPIDESLEPDLLVTERTRGFGERELSLDELILERGVELLLTEEPAAEQVA